MPAETNPLNISFTEEVEEFQDAEEHQERRAGSNSIFSRIAKLPIVAFTISQLNETYQQVKLQHTVLKSVCGKAEEGLLTARNLVSDIATKTPLQRPLSYVDSSACYILDKMTERLPIITCTPGEIISNTKRMFDDRVQPCIDNLMGVKENTIQKCSDVKELGSAKLSAVVCLGTSTVGAILDSPATAASKVVGWGINSVNSFVDVVLPEPNRIKNGNGKCENNYAKDSINAGKREQIKNISTKVYSRLAVRSVSYYQSVSTSWNKFRQKIVGIYGRSAFAEINITKVQQQSMTVIGNLAIQLRGAVEGSRHNFAHYFRSGHSIVG